MKHQCEHSGCTEVAAASQKLCQWHADDAIKGLQLALATGRLGPNVQSLRHLRECHGISASTRDPTLSAPRRFRRWATGMSSLPGSATLGRRRPGRGTQTSSSGLLARRPEVDPHSPIAIDAAFCARPMVPGRSKKNVNDSHGEQPYGRLATRFV